MSGYKQWRCPECDTWNTEDECILCGEKRPNANISQNEQRIKVNFNNDANLSSDFQSSLKKPQTGSEDNNTSRRQKNQISSGKKKHSLGIVAACICVVAVLSVVLAVRKHEDEITTVNVIPQLSEVYYSSNEPIGTVAIESETEHLSSAVSNYTVASTSAETIVPTSADTTTENYIQMPSIIGMECNDATSLLDSLGISYNVTLSDKKYVGIDTNCVYLQSYKSGSKVKKGVVVDVGVSIYKLVTTAEMPSETTVQTTTTPKVTTAQTTTTPKVTTAQTTTTPKVTTAQTTTTPKVTTIQETTTQEITTETAASIMEQKQTMILPVRTRFDLDNAVMPIEGTSWSDYKWESGNTAKLQIISGVMTTYSVGTVTITATLKSDESKVFTTTVKIVRQDQYYTEQTTTTYDDSWFYDMYNETAFSIPNSY